MNNYYCALGDQIKGASEKKKRRTAGFSDSRQIRKARKMVSCNQSLRCTIMRFEDALRRSFFERLRIIILNNTQRKKSFLQCNECVSAHPRPLFNLECPKSLAT